MRKRFESTRIMKCPKKQIMEQKPSTRHPLPPSTLRGVRIRDSLPQDSQSQDSPNHLFRIRARLLLPRTSRKCSHNSRPKGEKRVTKGALMNSDTPYCILIDLPDCGVSCTGVLSTDFPISSGYIAN